MYEDQREFYTCPLCGTGTGNDIDNEIYGTPDHHCPVEEQMLAEATSQNNNPEELNNNL